MEGYYQETGRAGRDGGEGICIAFYARKDLRKLEKFMENKPVAEQDIGRQFLQETAAYAESSVCRQENVACIISVKNIMRKTAITVTTVCILQKNLRRRMRCLLS